MFTEKRLWRTADGGLVEDGHVDAVLLAYGEDDEVSAEDLDLVPEPEPEPEPEKPEEKATAKPSPSTPKRARK